MHYPLSFKTFNEAFEVHARLKEIDRFSREITVRIIIEAELVKSEKTEMSKWGKITARDTKGEEFYSGILKVNEMKHNLKSLVDEIALPRLENTECNLRTILILIDTGEFPLEYLKGIYNTAINVDPNNS